MKHPPKFFVYVPAKTYVYRFLEINYGNPVDFSNHPEHERKLISLLEKPKRRYDTRYPDHLLKFNMTAEIVISRDVFMRYGYKLSKTGIISFGKYFEDIIKITARNYIQFKRGFCSLKESILDFQELFNLQEDYWSYESIKKEIDRNGTETRIDFREDLTKSIDQAFLDHMGKSKQKLITLKGLKYYQERV